MVPIYSIQPGKFFLPYCMDRSRTKVDISKRDVIVSSSWCENMSIFSLKHTCTPNLEYLTIKCCLFYLPLEFTSFMVRIVIFPRWTWSVFFSGGYHHCLLWSTWGSTPDHRTLLSLCWGTLIMPASKRQCQTSTNTSLPNQDRKDPTTIVKFADDIVTLLMIRPTWRRTDVRMTTSFWMSTRQRSWLWTSA